MSIRLQISLTFLILLAIVLAAFFVFARKLSDPAVFWTGGLPLLFGVALIGTILVRWTARRRND